MMDTLKLNGKEEPVIEEPVIEENDDEMGESFVLSKYYKDRLKNISRDGEMRAERFATIFRFFLYGLLVIFGVLSLLGGRPLQEFIYLMCTIGAAMVYNLVAYFILRKTDSYFPYLKYVSTAIEITTLSIILAFLTWSQKNPTMPYTGAIALLYFVLIALASIRNDHRVVTLALVLTIIQYGAICFYFLPEMTIINKTLGELTKTISPVLASEGITFKIISIGKVSIVLKLLYIGVTGFLIIYALLNSRRTSNKQSTLIFNTEKEAILKEKEKSDYLLLNILPKQIAQELKEKGETVPKKFDSVSVLFTDFKGFTQISERLSPEDLIEELDVCFRYFDTVMDKYGLEKIKTIGDAYMCAGGLPRKNPTHAVDCVLAALDIQNYMNHQKTLKTVEGKPYWELRAGIHTGNVIAGVVGKKKFAYDIWGDTVNTASRMESSGEPGRVNISIQTYEDVKDFFVCQYRGQLVAKNKGRIKMYFVHSIVPELSVDGKGLVPTSEFMDKLSEQKLYQKKEAS